MRTGSSTSSTSLYYCFILSPLQEKQISTLKEGMDVIAMGTKEKHVAETKMNLDSSRSHTMCTFNLIRTNKQFMREIIATCRIVDLAGSERLNRTNASGERSQEAGHINTDLMYLMQCLRSLVDSQSKPNQRVIFRNCRLTHLLSVERGEREVRRRRRWWGRWRGPCI